MPVSCYICGRDFGTKSISIHIPSCKKKWEAAQKKLPRSERRPLPPAPRDLDKVISGELKGEELDKFNSDTLQEWNDVALVPCDNCKRTFLPASLKVHKKMCTEDNPMVKMNKEDTYANRQKSKVNYPKLKKTAKSNDAEEVLTNEDANNDTKPRRPTTYKVTKESQPPTREDIMELIQTSKRLEDEEARSTLLKIINNFLRDDVEE